MQRQRRADVQQRRALRPDCELRGSDALLRRDDNELRGLHAGIPMHAPSEHLPSGNLHGQRLRGGEQDEWDGVRGRNRHGDVHRGELPGVCDGSVAVQERGDEHGADV